MSTYITDIYANITEKSTKIELMKFENNGYFLITPRTYKIGHYNPSVTTRIMLFVLILSMSGVVGSERWQFYLLLEVSPQEIFFDILFHSRSLRWSLKHWISFNKSTQYLLDYGDFE